MTVKRAPVRKPANWFSQIAAVAQETMLRVWRKADRFDPSAGDAAAWIFTIARNLRIDALRRARGQVTEGASDIEGEFLRDEAPLPDMVLAAVQTSERVRRALAKLPAAPWRWVAPGVLIQRLTPPAASATRVFLRKSKAGLKFRQHGHDDVELTCVLTGSFSHHGQRFAPGDFDHGTADDDHHIAIGNESECICLVAMRGRLQFRGLIGRLVQPLMAI